MFGHIAAAEEEKALVWLLLWFSAAEEVYAKVHINKLFPSKVVDLFA